MTHHVFVDEVKHRGYAVAAAYSPTGQLIPARRTLSRLLLPDQRRLHSKSECDSRRREILAALRKLDIQARIHVAPQGLHEVPARSACLRAVLDDALAAGATRMVLELDEVAEDRDRRLLGEALVKAGGRDALAYEHIRARLESLLWIPDALLWSWRRGGDWLRRVRHLLVEIRQV